MLGAALDIEEIVSRLSPQDLDLALEAAESRRDLLRFAEIFWHVNDPEEPFVNGWPIQAIADHLMAVTDGHIKRLIVNVPPGFSKSLLTDVFWPAWEWGPCGMPTMRYLAAAYTSALTQRDNGRFLRVLLDPKFLALWGAKFALTKIGAKKVENDRTGWKLATSVEGYGTGERGNRIIVDDPNNPKDVESDIVREGTNLWLREVMPDRLNNLKEGAIVIIQQRTHEHDASGTLIDVMGRDYVLLMIPMEYDPTRHCHVSVTGWHDPRGLDADGNLLDGFLTDPDDGEMIGQVVRGSAAELRAGKLAWAERFPREICDSMSRVKGAFAWNGQYQQLPTPRGGGLIQEDWWRLWPTKDFPDFGTTIVSLDTAIKEKEIDKQDPDWNAITVWSAFGDDDQHPQLMLRFAQRMRGSLGEVVKMVADACQKYRADTLIVEDRTRGYDVAQEIRTQYGTRAWSTVLLDPTQWGLSASNKVARVIACQSLFSGELRTRDERTGICTWTGGVIWAPNTEWAEEVIQECKAFPRGAHDDYVDTISQALLYLRRSGVVLRKLEWDEMEAERRKLENLRDPPPIYPV